MERKADSYYKELIKRGHNWKSTNFRQELNESRKIIVEMGDAIEALMAERDTALSRCRGDCDECAYADKDADEFPCCDCCYSSTDLDKSDRWEWRGPQKEEV